jgi:hypothetical protein
MSEIEFDQLAIIHSLRNGECDQNTCHLAANLIEHLTLQRDEAVKLIADWCVSIEVNGTGWDDWDEHFKNATYETRNAVPNIRSLLDKAMDQSEQWGADNDDCG